MAKQMRIPDGNAFKLRIAGQIKTGEYVETADFSVVRNMIVNFVRRGREAQTSSVDGAGRIVVENDGSLARGVYGVELTGYYNGEPWRFYVKDVFQIVNENAESDEPTGVDNVPVYDVTVDVSFGGDGVTAAFVEAAMTAHNNDIESHSDMRSDLAGKVDDVLVDGESVVETDPATGKRTVGFRREQFGKVDDVKVNGESVLNEANEANIVVPTTVEEFSDSSDYAKKTDLQTMQGQVAQAISDTVEQLEQSIEDAAVSEVEATVDNNTGTPEVDYTFENGKIQLDFKNLKGEKGDKMQFSDLTEAEKESLKGPQGDSAVYNPEDPDTPDFVMANEKGNSTTKSMTQKAVTDEIDRIDGRFDGVDKDIYRNSKVVDGETVYENDYYKTAPSPYNSSIAEAQRTVPSTERVTFNRVIFGPVKRRLGTGAEVFNYRICVLASGDTLKVASGGTTLAEGTFYLTTEYKSFEVKLQEEAILEVGECVVVSLFRIGYAAPKIMLASGNTASFALFNEKSQYMTFIPHTGSTSDTIIADMEAARDRVFSHGGNAASGFHCASPILRLVRQSDLDNAIGAKIQSDVPVIVEEKVEEAKPSIIEEAVEAAIEAARQSLQGVRVWLPEKIYAVVGDTLQLFYKGIVEAPNPYIYAIFAQCSIGSSFKRYFEVTPTATQVGTKTLTIYVKDGNGNIVGQASTQLVVKATPSSPQTQKKILCLGASTTVHGEWPNELKRRLSNTNSVNGISGLGLQNISVKYYGHGGWAWETYLSPATKQHRITVEGIGSVAVGATYTNNGNTYTVLEVNLTDGDGNILLGGSTVTPSAGGTLALASGSGDATITMLTVKIENENPLWDATNNKFSFVPWVTEQGGVDVLYAMLNGNGLSPWETFSMEDTTGRVANLKQAARTFHQEYPDAKIVFMGPTMPSLNGGMASNYGATGMADDYGMAKACFNLARLYKEFVNDEEFSPYVELADITTQFDCEYNYPRTSRAANRRRQNSTAVTDVAEAYKVIRDSNGLHPENAGYYQIADAVYRHFIGVHL